MLAAARPVLPVWKDAATGLRFAEHDACPDGFVASSVDERDTAIVAARQVLAQSRRSRMATDRGRRVDRLVAAGFSVEQAELLVD